MSQGIIYKLISTNFDHFVVIIKKIKKRKYLSRNLIPKLKISTSNFLISVDISTFKRKK